MKNSKLKDHCDNDEIDVDQQLKKPVTLRENKRNLHKKCINYRQQSSSSQSIIDLQQQQNEIENQDDYYSPCQSDGSQHMKPTKPEKKLLQRSTNSHVRPLKSAKQITKQKAALNKKITKKNQIITIQNESQSNQSKQKKIKKKAIQSSSNSEISDNDHENQDMDDEKEDNQMIQQNSNSNISDAKNQMFVDEWSNSQSSAQQIDEKHIIKQYQLKPYTPPPNLNSSQIPILQPTPTQHTQPKQQPSVPQPPQNKQKIQQVLDYAHYYPTYKQRRLFKYINSKIDLNVRYLHEIVYDCYIEGLICKQLMINIKNMGLNNTLQFIQKYKQVKLSQFDFKKVKFTILDHRRLCSLLKQKGKRQYTDESPIFFLPYQLHLFMTEVYKLDQDSYQAICNTIDTSFNLFWWKTIGTDLQGNQPPKQQLNHHIQLKPLLRSTQRKKQKQKSTINIDNTSNSKMQDQQQLSIQNDKIKNQQDSHQHLQTSSIHIKSRSEKLSKPDDSFLYSSQIFQTQKVLQSNSMFSIDQNTHSLSDISDLLSESSNTRKKRKQSLQEMLQSQQQYSPQEKYQQKQQQQPQSQQKQQRPKKQKNPKKSGRPQKKMKKSSHPQNKKKVTSRKKPIKKKQKDQIFLSQ